MTTLTLNAPQATGTFDDIAESRGIALQETELETFLASVEKPAYHIAMGALWDSETALDVVQEAMLRLVQYYRAKPAAEWPALFRTVLNSRINDERRRRMLAATKRRMLSLTGLGGGDDESSANRELELPIPEHADRLSAPEAGTHALELGHLVQQAVGRLSERQRQVFLLREQQGLSIRGTATALGCSETSVKQHHFRALRALRKQLAEAWDEH